MLVVGLLVVEVDGNFVSGAFGVKYIDTGELGTTWDLAMRHFEDQVGQFLLDQLERVGFLKSVLVLATVALDDVATNTGRNEAFGRSQAVRVVLTVLSATVCLGYLLVTDLAVNDLLTCLTSVVNIVHFELLTIK